MGALGKQGSKRRHVFVAAGFQHRRGTLRDPSGRDQGGEGARAEVCAIGRVEEDQAAGRTGRRPGGIGGEDGCPRLGTAGGDVGPQHLGGGTVRLHEHRMRGAAGQRLQPERAGAGENVQHEGVP